MGQQGYQQCNLGITLNCMSITLSFSGSLSCGKLSIKNFKVGLDCGVSCYAMFLFFVSLQIAF